MDKINSYQAFPELDDSLCTDVFMDDSLLVRTEDVSNERVTKNPWGRVWETAGKVANFVVLFLIYLIPIMWIGALIDYFSTTKMDVAKPLKKGEDVEKAFRTAMAGNKETIVPRFQIEGKEMEKAIGMSGAFTRMNEEVNPSIAFRERYPEHADKLLEWINIDAFAIPLQVLSEKNPVFFPITGEFAEVSLNVTMEPKPLITITQHCFLPEKERFVKVVVKVDPLVEANEEGKVSVIYSIEEVARIEGVSFAEEAPKYV